LKYVGAKVPRLFDKYKVTGESKYIHDIEFPNMLYLYIVRSNVPHGVISKLDYTKLTLRESIKFVFSGKDVKLGNIGILKDQPPLKYPKVRKVGDEILAVVSTDLDKAKRYVEEDLELIIEELPAVFDPIEALKPGAPLVHEEFGTNLVNLNFNINSGNVEKAFNESHIVLEEEYIVPRVSHAPMGTLGAIAYIDNNGFLNLITNTQEPYQLKRELSESLGVDPRKVKIVQPDIGGTFGRGMDIYPFEVIAAYAALRLKKPIKIIYERSEDLSYSPTRQPAIIRIKSGVSKDGRLLARKVNVILDTGAYVSWGAFDARVMGATSSGLYAVSNISFEAKIVYTNNPYTINMRGAGNPQITFAIESHMDNLAEMLGMDPVEFRMLNSYEGYYVTPQRMIVDDAKFKTALKIAAERIGWKGRHSAGINGSKRYGIGFAGIFHVGGSARVYKTDGCGILLRVDDFGKVVIYTGYSEIGQGTMSSIAQIVASELGIPIDNVEVIFNGDSDNRPWDTATHASRTTFVCGNAALRAARKLREIILQEASRILKIPQENLEIKDGYVYNKSTGEAVIEFDKLIRRIHFRQNGNFLYSYEYYDPPNEMLDNENKGNVSAAYVTGFQAVLSEVDTETGKIRVIKVVTVLDVGKVINPLAAEGQIIGGVVQAIGHTLFEELKLNEGKVINPSFMDYIVPVVTDIPEEIEVIFLPSESKEGPYGAKGLAEDGIIGVAAAIANSIYDAIKVRVNKIPILPEDILKKVGK